MRRVQRVRPGRRLPERRRRGMSIELTVQSAQLRRSGIEAGFARVSLLRSWLHPVAGFYRHGAPMALRSVSPPARRTGMRLAGR